MIKNKLYLLSLLFSSSISSCISSFPRYTPTSLTDSSVDSVNSGLLAEEISTVDYSNKPKYTVSFFSVIGTTEFCCAIRTVVEGNQVQPPEDFSKPGGVFSGWYLEREYINLFDFNDPIYSDTSIYAKWEGEYVFSEYGNDAYSIIGYTPKDDGADLVLPSSFSGKPVVNIAKEAFANDKTINSITIPNSIVSISDRAFINCSNITTVSLPRDLIRIGSDAFAYCTSLLNIYYANTFALWSQIEIGESNLITKDGYIFKNCDSFKTLLNTPNDNIVLKPSDYNESSQLNFNAITGLTKIKDFTYCYLKQLTSLAISNPEFKLLGKYCFSRCTNLSTIILTNEPNLRTCEGSFYLCTSLNSISGANYINDIGEYTFYSCTGITSFYFSTRLTRINSYSFYNTRISSVVFTNSYAVDIICSYAFANCANVTTVGLKEVSYIQSYAFYNCTRISTFTYAGSQTTLDNKKNNSYYSTTGNSNLFNATTTYEG